MTTRQEPGGQPKIEYSLDTRRARTEVRGQVTQARLIKNLVREASSGQSLDPQIGSTLYKLLVPVELEAFLTSAGETQMVLDEGTAGIPWEMLDDDDGSRGNEPPWAIRSKLLRKFKTETFRQQVKDTDSRDAHPRHRRARVPRRTIRRCRAPTARPRPSSSASRRRFRTWRRESRR